MNHLILRDTLPGAIRSALLVACTLALFTWQAQAQLTGTKTIPGDYPTIAAAFTDLNALGVGSGGVTFNVAAGHTETSVNLVLTNTTPSAANPILFQKSGIGANPKITAGVGTSTTTDAIIAIEGTDYVTFDRIDLEESAGNTDPTTQMEWGYAVLMTDGDNASQNITIKNCVITLNKANPASVGIYMRNHKAGSTTTITPTSDGGRTSYCLFQGNVISNVYIGMSISGASTGSSWYAIGNEMNGNTITNYGGGTTQTRGIYSIYQQDGKILNNIINGGAGTTTFVDGIIATTGSGTLDLSGNTVTITNGTTTNLMYAIRVLGSRTKLTISNNVVENCANTTASSGNLFGIENSTSSSTDSVLIFGNTIRNNTHTGTGTFTGIEGGAGNIIMIYGNAVYGNTKTGASGSMFCIRAATAQIQCYGNSVYNNTIPTTSGTTSSSLYGYYNVSSPTLETIYNNSIYNLSIGGTGTSTSMLVTGIHTNSVAGATKSIYGNTIYGLATPIGNAIGIQQTLGATVEIFKNEIYNVSTAAANATNYAGGIVVSSGTDVTVYNNFISDLRATASTNPNGVIGINYTSTAATTALKALYNTISLDASSSGTGFGSSGISSPGSATSTTGSLELRNNIVVNRSTPSGSGLNVALRRTNTNLANYSNNSNNNCFYAGTSSATNLIFYDGTNADQLMSLYQARVSPRDVASFSVMPPFVNSATTPYNLRLQNAATTQCESGGAIISSPIVINHDFDGDVRFGGPGYSGTGSAPDVGADEFEGQPLTPMAYASSTTVQNTNAVFANSTNNHILRIEIVTTGLSSPLTVTSFTLNTNGSTNATADITNAKLFYTGTSSTFGTSSQFGPTFASPPAAPTTYNITGSQTLVNGTNYFWLTYDVPVTATGSNVVDAEVPSITIDAVGRVPSVTAPAGNRSIIAPLAGTYTIAPSEPYPFNSFTNVSAVLGSAGVSGPVTFNVQAGSGPYNEQVEFTTIPGASATNTITINGNGQTISATPTASNRHVIKLNGAQRMTFNNLRIVGTDATYGWGIHLISQANYNTVTNCTIDLSAVTSTTESNSNGIVATNSTTSTSTAGNNANFCTFSNNTIRGGPGGGPWGGMRLNGNTGGLDAVGHQIVNNVVRDFYSVGIELTNCDGAQVNGNNIHRMNRVDVTIFEGITLGTGSRNVRVEKNRIHNTNDNATNQSTTTYGIYFNSVDAPIGSENVAVNNLLYNLNGPTGIIYGIYNSGSDGAHIFYNSISIDNAGSTAGTTRGFYQTTTATNIEFRNNIISITRGGTGTKHVLYFGAAGSTIASNRNVLYINAPDGTNHVGFLTTNRTTLGDWQTTGFDANSIDTNPLFNSLDVLVPQAGSPALNAGAAIAGYTTDFLGVTRHATTPSIGAYENGGDALGPAISYTPLDNTTSTLSRTLVANITDPSGVQTGANGPRLYYKKSTDVAYAIDSTPGVSGSDYTFNLNYANVGGGSVTGGDVIQYYVASQDLGGVVSTRPAGGSGASPPGTVPPENPNSYLIVGSTLSGDYTVGVADFNRATGKNLSYELRTRKVVREMTVEEVTLRPSVRSGIPTSGVELAEAEPVEEVVHRTIQVEEEETYGVLMENGVEYSGPMFATSVTEGVQGIYPTITAAIMDVTARGVGGATRFLLTDTSYPSETFPIVIGPIPGSSASSTVTIKPDAAVTTVVSGGGVVLFDLAGATHFIFDGSNSLGGTSRDMTLRNTSTSGSVLRFMNGASNVSVRNSIIEGGNTSSTNGIVLVSTSTGGSNTGLSLTNNQIRDRSDSPAATAPVNAIYAAGTAGVPNTAVTISANQIFNFSGAGVRVTTTGNGDGWSITDNHFFNDRSTVPSTAQTSINFTPGAVSGTHLITGNVIGGTTAGAGGSAWVNSGAVAFIGIVASVDTVDGSLIENNVVRNVSLTSTSTATFTGISVTGGRATVKQNTIGHNSTPNSINVAGSSTTHGINIAAKKAPGNVVENIIANMTAAGTGTSVRVRGITMQSDTLGLLTVTGNTIHTLSTNSSGAGISATSSPVAMGVYYFSSTYTGVDVSSNTIHGIAAGNSGAFGSVVAGIVATNFVGRIGQNLIYDIRNLSTGVSTTSPPSAAGIFLRFTINPTEISNNMISLGSDQTSATSFVGIWSAHPTASPSPSFNSVHITGTAGGGAHSTYGFLRGDNSGNPVNSTVTLRNNILNNVRSGGTGAHYAIANQSGTASDTGWAAGASDYNLLNTSNAATLGLWGSAQAGFAGWQTASAGDAMSVTGDPLFVSATNLHVTGPSSPAANAGVPVGGITVDIDNDVRSVATPDIGADEFGGSLVAIGVSINTGWNLISNPVTRSTGTDSVKQLFPNSLFNYAFAFSAGAGYTQSFRMTNGPGFWGKFPGSDVNVISGGSREVDSITVVSGWNIVGSISSTVDTASITSVPSGIKASLWFGYAAGYSAVSQLVPGKGYWVKASAPGRFILTSPAPGLARGSADMTEGWNSITIGNSHGSQKLLFGPSQPGMEDASFVMPPAPPEGAFDARFSSPEGGSMLRSHPAVLEGDLQYPITVQPASSEPVTVSWSIQGPGGVLYELLDASGTVRLLSGEGTVVLSSAAASHLVLKTGGTEVPAEFALSQNYPNPFNPSTHVQLALPVHARVKVEVYNVLGQKIRTLVEEDRKAGYHVVEWDGRSGDGSAVASGVYFLHMSADGPGVNFRQVRKALMQK